MASLLVGLVFQPETAMGLPPCSRLWDMMVPPEAVDPFRILEHSPFAVPKSLDTTVTLAQADWKETPLAHFITLDVPGVKKEDIKIEMEGRALRISGERKGMRRRRRKATRGTGWRGPSASSGCSFGYPLMPTWTPSRRTWGMVCSR